MVTVVKPKDNNGYGYIEFTLDGSDYTGSYKSTTHLPKIPGASWTYHYDLVMNETENAVGTKLYSINITYIDSRGKEISKTITRSKGKKVRICSGEFDTRDGMIKFWKNVSNISN